MALRPPRSAVSFSVVTKLKALLLVLGIAVLVVSGACLPHLHASGEFGLWSEEHDLSLMAALGTAASQLDAMPDRKSTRLNSSHVKISYAVFCLKKKKKE